MKSSREVETPLMQTAVSDIARFTIALLFLGLVLAFSLFFIESNSNHLFLAVAAVFGAYMAMNIGANDVANNVGPAVGSKALTMGWAIVIAMVFEAGGAFIAGGEVVSTIKKGIIDIDAFGDDTDRFLWAMMAALLAAALWLNLATVARAPVSTTHSIVSFLPACVPCDMVEEMEEEEEEEGVSSCGDGLCTSAQLVESIGDIPSYPLQRHTHTIPSHTPPRLPA